MYNFLDELCLVIEVMLLIFFYFWFFNVGLEYVWDNIFIFVNGDRVDVWNYYIFIGIGLFNMDFIGREIWLFGNVNFFVFGNGFNFLLKIWFE